MGAVAISLTIALIFVYVPFVNAAVGMTALDFGAISLAALIGLLPPIAEEITKIFVRRQPTGS